ncbi:hypothetical protein [Bacillus sinesaloumensis]|uniref:hypothetical protein n=1 Tax=Litchfieldia sinesaloumensis TaxID=1926280 RepID=UPI0009883D78|nr:hypothetical protein [Bacillus sinesaloumensis]
MYYESVSTFIYVFLILWITFLVFQRIGNRYPKSNPWKKDIKLTFVQALVITLIWPFIGLLLYYFDV